MIGKKDQQTSKTLFACFGGKTCGTSRQAPHVPAPCAEKTEKGKIIYLNGLSSSGKTCIIHELLDREDFRFYTLAFDMLEDSVPYYMSSDNRCYAQSIIAMYHAARSFSDQGQNVLLDGLVYGMEGLENHYEKLMEIFQGYPIYFVHVHCPLDVCRQRNSCRDDRWEGQSEEQNRTAEQNISYSLELDTAQMSPAEAVNALLRHFRLEHYTKD